MAEVNFMLCVVAFLLAACVVVPLAVVAVLAVAGRRASGNAPMPRDYDSPRGTV